MRTESGYRTRMRTRLRNRISILDRQPGYYPGYKSDEFRMRTRIWSQHTIQHSSQDRIQVASKDMIQDMVNQDNIQVVTEVVTSILIQDLKKVKGVRKVILINSGIAIFL